MSEQNDILHDWGKDLQILLRDQFKCVYCGLDGSQSAAAFRQIARYFDHLVPKAWIRDESIHNLVTCCQPCNWAKLDFDPRVDAIDSQIGDPDELRQLRIARVREHLAKPENGWAYWGRAYDAIKRRYLDNPN